MDLDRVGRAWVVLSILAIAAPAVAVGLPSRPEPDPGRGRDLYQSRCAVCHGARGDGRGPAAASMVPRPRDFTRGEYRIRSTAPGRPATGADLYRTLSRGMPGTAMPAWSALSEADRWALVDYVQSLSPRFADPEAPSIRVPPVPAVTAEALSRGEDTFRRLACPSCHGDGGRGDGPAARALRDSTGQPIRPLDLARGRPKRGDAPEDLFVTVRSGIEGTPMPGFEGVISDSETWDLVFYVRTLSLRSPPQVVRSPIVLSDPVVPPAVVAAPAGIGPPVPDVPVEVTAAPPSVAENPPPPPATRIVRRPARAPVPAGAVARGGAVYATFCVPCHGTDGKGPIGANFIADPTRLAKPDAELLRTIRQGMTGNVGVMPAWGAVLDAGQQADVLQYLRATFGER